MAAAKKLMGTGVLLLVLMETGQAETANKQQQTAGKEVQAGANKAAAWLLAKTEFRQVECQFAYRVDLYDRQSEELIFSYSKEYS